MCESVKQCLEAELPGRRRLSSAEGLDERDENMQYSCFNKGIGSVRNATPDNGEDDAEESMILHPNLFLRDTTQNHHSHDSWDYSKVSNQSPVYSPPKEMEVPPRCRAPKQKLVDVIAFMERGVCDGAIHPHVPTFDCKPKTPMLVEEKKPEQVLDPQKQVSRKDPVQSNDTCSDSVTQKEHPCNANENCLTYSPRGPVEAKKQQKPASLEEDCREQDSQRNEVNTPAPHCASPLDMVPSVLIIKSFDAKYFKALNYIRSQNVIAIHTIPLCHRLLRPSLLVISTFNHTIIFDFISLGKVFKEFGDILSAERPIKVVHQAYMLADFLKRCHNIALNGVYDTYVTHCILNGTMKDLTASEVIESTLQIDLKALESTMLNGMAYQRPLVEVAQYQASLLTALLLKLYDHQVNKIILGGLYKTCSDLSTHLANTGSITDVTFAISLAPSPLSSIELPRNPAQEISDKLQEFHFERAKRPDQ